MADRSVYLPSGILVLAGLWLTASPWVLDEPTLQPGVLNAVVVGILVALLAAGNIRGVTRSTILSWLTAALGLWTVAAPFVFGHASSSPWTWSSVITGVIVLALGLVDATTRPLAAVPPQLAGVVHGPWVGGRYLPGFAFEYEDYPLWPLLRGREGWGSQRESWQGEFRGIGPRGWRRPDEQIMSDVCRRMADDPRLDASEIDVTVAEGAVTLQGVVSGRPARRLAEDIADSVSGVRDVANQLRMRDRHGEIRRAA